MKKIDQKPLVLASASPRRKLLLEQMGIYPVIHPAMIDESDIPWQAPDLFVTTLAEQKAKAVASTYPDHWVIGADTIVVLNGNPLGKPASKEQAVHMLESLSGNTHSVHTGYAICHDRDNRLILGSVCSQVMFKALSEDEIQWYTDTDEPYDKAGAYGVQGIGAFLVEKIQGSYSNVVGLPVCEVFNQLLHHDIIQIIDQ
ncbi:MAG: septum formation inhibitor Maf [Desulfobacteraceae bacterium]|nr:MAG: septum formation inhibitor Maf [Desulfobacteraceae bacterium]